MGVMGSTNREVAGYRRAVEFWRKPGRSHFSGNAMRAAARGFAASELAKKLHPDEVRSFVETTYTLSKIR